MPSFLRVLNVFFMNLQRNTEAETAEMTSRCMRSHSNASLIKMPTFRCFVHGCGPREQHARGKKYAHYYSHSSKDSLLQTDKQMCADCILETH